jgi:group I intron endonuclease
VIVYKITNKINGKCYIGQTINSLETRWYYHCRKNSFCRYLGNAIQKYGKEAFSVEVIAECQTPEDLNNTEKHFIEVYNSLAPNGYNLREGGGGYGKMSEEAKKKMKESWVPRPIKRKYLRSEETRKRMSAAQKGKIVSEETRRKMSEATKNRILVFPGYNPYE